MGRHTRKSEHTSVGCWLMKCLILMCVSLLSTSCRGPSNGMSSAALADFEWFSTLGFPDVNGCPCVRLENGGSWTAKGEAMWIERTTAFVIATNAGTLKLFTVDLSDCSVTNASLPKGGVSSRGFERVDLRAQAKAQIQKIESGSPQEGDPFRLFHPTSEGRAEVFVLAWACWRQGLFQEAQRLYDSAQTLPVRNHDYEHSRSFRGALEQDVGHDMMRRAVAGLGDPSVSRTEILRRLETIPRNYPHSRHCERATRTARVLKRMIAEDQVHATFRPPDSARARIGEQVRELIYQLRDQNGCQRTTPGRCDIFDSWSSDTNTAAHQLVRLGYPAVPQLIAVLDSDTLTRSLGAIRFTQDPDFVLTVGDCAEAILQSITGKSFFGGRSGGGYLSNTYMSAAGEGPAVRKAAEAWWADFQKKGERQALVDGVASGGPDAPAQAGFLTQRYPDVATEALVRGAKTATNGSVRADLVDQIGTMGKPSSLEFLRDELVHGPQLQSRVAAAFALRTLEHGTAVAAMIEEWRRKPEQTEESKKVWEQVPEFLTGCDSNEAISALTADIGQRSPEAKYRVVLALGDTNRWFWRHEAQPASPKTVEATEAALVVLLEDTTECFNTSYHRIDKGLMDPRVCDLAAWFLSDRWPGRYSFDVEGTLEGRNRQRLLNLNAWRTAHNLPAVPVPAPKPITERPKVGSADSTVVTSVEWSEDSAEPLSSFAARISAMKNQRLDAGRFVEVLTTFASHPESNAMGFDLKAFRGGDLTGVRLIARLIPGPPPGSDGTIGWHVSRDVELGGHLIQGSSGGGGTTANDWEDLASGIKKAVSSLPETPFEISARIVGVGGVRITKPNR